ncbi:MAG: glycosyltransferase [Elusimicrobia bacterium]|nr:glycosyltransferase [Elusimicrobiota bacterium]
MSRSRILDYYLSIGPEWEKWQGKNAYYHCLVRDLVMGMTRPRSRILEIGAGVGDLSELLVRQSETLIGLNYCEELTLWARARVPRARFHTVDIDEIRIPSGFSPDCVIMRNMLDYVHDLSEMAEKLAKILPPDGILIVTTSNPMWASLLRAAARLGLRFPESPRNYITNNDIKNILELQGFCVVEAGMAAPMPKYIPLFSWLMNLLIPEIPVARYIGATQYLCARPIKPRPPLSCSVIIPCHNEEGNIARTVRRVPRMGTTTEVIVVDDGSSDGTRKAVEALMAEDPAVRLVRFDKNRGKAEAVFAGFTAAKGDVVMILDADATVEPEVLPRFFKPIQEGRADFVNGTRLIYPMEKNAMRFMNFLGNKAFCLLASKVLRQRVSDTLCGTKAMLRRDFLDMPRGGADRWGDFALLFGAAKLKLRIREMPLYYQERTSGKSKMRGFVEVWRFLWACWQGWRMLRLGPP